jgi:hypothetical protein
MADYLADALGDARLAIHQGHACAPSACVSLIDN